MKMAEKTKRKFSFSGALHTAKEAIHPSSVTWLSWKETKKGALRAFVVMSVCAVFAVGADALMGFVLKLVM